MKQKVGIVAILLLIGAIVMVSGCTSSNAGTGPENCPMCGEHGIMPMEMDNGTIFYTCADCGIFWGEYPEDDMKMWSYISDFEDDGQITDDEVHIAQF